MSTTINANNTARRRAAEPRDSGKNHAAALNERLWIAPAARSMLAAAGMTNFESFMQTPSGECLRALPDRENWKLRLTGPDGSPRIAYLKKHHEVGFFAKVCARLWSSGRPSPARVEAENAALLSASGVPTFDVLAYGERFDARRGAESFFLTAELAGYLPLDDFLKQRFPGRTAAGKRDAALTRLLENVTDLAARFHKLGGNHRDFYCCHFFIRGRGGEFQVHLIDLQRVQFRTRWRRRWIVKDLAQLAYSAPKSQVTRGMRMRFFKRYLGVERLDGASRRLLRAVLRKQRSLERKHGAHP